MCSYPSFLTRYFFGIFRYVGAVLPGHFPALHRGAHTRGRFGVLAQAIGGEKKKFGFTAFV